jgi:hypothetical protein
VKRERGDSRDECFETPQVWNADDEQAITAESVGEFFERVSWPREVFENPPADDGVVVLRGVVVGLNVTDDGVVDVAVSAERIGRVVDTYELSFEGDVEVEHLTGAGIEHAVEWLVSVIAVEEAL